MSLQSLIFLIYTYYLTLQFVDKNNLADFQYFPKVPVCTFNSWHGFPLSLQHFLCSDFLPSEFLSRGTPPKPLLLWPDRWVFSELSFFSTFVPITAVRKSGLWDPISQLTHLMTRLWSIFLKVSHNTSTWSSQQLKLAWHKQQGPRMDIWLRIKNTRPQKIPEKEPYSQLHIQGFRDEWGKDPSENGKKSV